MIAMSINDEGAITGWYEDSSGIAHSFICSPGGNFSTFDFGTMGTYAQSMNDAGAITGYYIDSGFHAFLRAPGGSITTIDPPNCVVPQAAGINQLGAITGYCEDSNSTYEGFLRSPGVD